MRPEAGEREAGEVDAEEEADEEEEAGEEEEEAAAEEEDGPPAKEQSHGRQASASCEGVAR